MAWRKPALVLLCFTVLAPILLYTDRLSTNSGFGDDVSNLESSNTITEPIGIVYLNNWSSSGQVSDQSRDGSAELSGNELPRGTSGDQKSRVLSVVNEGTRAEMEGMIEQVMIKESQNVGLEKSRLVEKNDGDAGFRLPKDATASERQENKHEKHYEQTPAKVDQGKHQISSADKQSDNTAMPDVRVRYLRDQLIRAKVYLDLETTRSNVNFIRELRGRIGEVQRVLGDAIRDSVLSNNANEKLKAMEKTLAKGKQIQDDCSYVIKKLRASLRSTEVQLRVHKEQTTFLTQLAAKTLPKGLHCLPLKLSAEYYSLDPSQQQFPNQEKLEDPKLYHYALFSDNILAAAVVVNSTVFNAKHPADHVFHIVTDRLNYAAMRMWFLANPPRKATIQVQNIEEFTWLNASYSPVLKQLESQSMINYYFKTHRANSDANLKYQNPKYLSILNHLRFYLPEIFPKLNRIVFLDDDIVVQKDLTGLWRIDLKGMVNGAVETCRGNFHRFLGYLNFSNPLISKNFDRHACGWAYGMNVFDLAEWRNQKLTEVYHFWQKRNHQRQLWKLGTLPPALITFWKRTLPLDRSWHVLGLGYDPNVNQRDIERAAVIHYNGNKKPWLEIGMPKYRNYWSKYVDYDQVYLQDCNINN